MESWKKKGTKGESGGAKFCPGGGMGALQVNGPC